MLSGIIKRLSIGFLRVIGSTTLDHLLTGNATPLQIVNTGTTYTTPTSVSTFAGRVQAQNTSGGTLGTLTIVVKNTLVTANSVIQATAEADPHSASGVQYIAQVVSNSRVAGASFQVALHKATPTASSSFNNNEGCSFSYIIIN